MSDVFISHASADADIALQIALHLEEEGYHTWCYEAKEVVGAAYRRKIDEAINECRAVILIISRNALESEELSIELNNADVANKNFIPLFRGMTYDELTKLKPKWLQYLRGAVAINIDNREISSTIRRIVKGLKDFGVDSSGKADTKNIKEILEAMDRVHQPPIPEPPSKVSRKNPALILIAALTLLIVIIAAAWIVVCQNSEEPPPPTPTPPPSITPTPSPTTTLTPSTAPTPPPTTTLTPSTAPTPTPTGYGFESETTMGWRNETRAAGNLAVSEVSTSDELAKLGAYSLKLSANLVGGDVSKSKGEVYVDLRYDQQFGTDAPLDMDGAHITCWVFAPLEAVGDPASPNGIQVFVKDINWKGEYGAWTNIVGGSWFQVSLTPSASEPEGGYMDLGFDPTNIVSVGVKIAAGSGSTATYVGPVYLDEVRW